LDVSRFKWDEFVRDELSVSSWKAHVIGRVRVQTDSKLQLITTTKITSQQNDDEDNDNDFRKSRAKLNSTDFSLSMIIHKVILISRVAIDSPSQSDFVEQLDVCFIKGHDHQMENVYEHHRLLVMTPDI